MIHECFSPALHQVFKDDRYLVWLVQSGDELFCPGASEKNNNLG